jgi:hypothetical protein
MQCDAVLRQVLRREQPLSDDTLAEEVGALWGGGGGDEEYQHLGGEAAALRIAFLLWPRRPGHLAHMAGGGAAGARPARGRRRAAQVARRAAARAGAKLHPHAAP